MFNSIKTALMDFKKSGNIIKLHYLSNGSILMLLTLSFLMLLFTFLSLHSVVSIFYYCSFGVSLLLLVMQLIIVFKSKKMRKKSVILLSLCLFSIVISMVAPFRVIATPLKLKKFIFFITTITFLLSITLGQWFTFTKKSAVIFAQLTSLLIIFIFIFFPHNFDEDGLMKFYFDNANKAAIFFNSLSLLLIIGIYLYRKSFVTILNANIIVLLSVFIFLTNCRIGMLSQIMLIILAFGFSFKWFFKWYFYIPIIISSLLFAGFLYLSYKFHWIEEFRIFGKGFYTRVSDYWKYTFETPFGELFFGKYDHYVGVGGQNRESFQMHNMLVDVLTSYGIPSLIGFVSFIVYDYHFLIKNTKNDKVKYVALSTFLVVFIVGWTEAMFVSGGLCYYIISIIPLLFLNKKNPTLSQVEKNEN